MMGHRAKLKNGDEWDAFKAKHIVGFSPGVIRKIKRIYHKRLRQIARREISKDIEE
jgi:hypothetical protein